MNKWTDDNIIQQLKQIANNLGHFPSTRELRQRGRNDLACAMTKRGGIAKFVPAVGVSRQHSDSDTGWEGEAMVLDILQARGFSVTKPIGVKSPFDLLVHDALRVDVKAARYAEYGACKGWFYRIGKMPQADIIILVQLDTRAIYGLPWQVRPYTNVTISRTGGTYARYLNNFDLIRRMADARRDELAAVLAAIAR
jgi:hypothetical protein